MKDFVLLFRRPDFDLAKLSPSEMQSRIKKWSDWAGEIEARGKLVNQGSRLGEEGKVLKPVGVVTDGPFVEIREMLGGFIVVRAENIDEATTLAHGCPVLDDNGSVEIRPVYE